MVFACKDNQKTEAEQSGDFLRTVDVYGNIPGTLTLSFTGTVK